MRKISLLISFIFSSFFIHNQVMAINNVESIFKQLAPSLYQIKLIDIASGEKSSIGSGFQISAKGLIATNYHVISGYARYPEKYKMQYLDHEGGIGDLTLKSVDVINDLAIVERKATTELPFFNIAEKAPQKGEELYSLGNPHDLGMIVVPGTYNGLEADSFNDRIHFTGSVNSGMSGGPVVNEQAEVVGVNVATAGNQIGFLVPHDKLIALFTSYQQSPPQSVDEQMNAQLFDYQEALSTSILSADWQPKYLGEALIPTINLPYVRCWGNSNADKEEALIFTAVANCSLDENTYIEGNFFTGHIEMDFRYMKAKDISDAKFYSLYEKRISQTGPSNKAGKDNVGNFQCNHDIIDNQGMKNKTIFCTRAYKDFSQLFDIIFVSASIDKGNEAIISHFTLAGVSQKNALLFTEKFIAGVAWKQ